MKRLTTALANRIDYSISRGNFAAGSIFAAFESPWSASMSSNVPTNLRIALGMVMFSPSTCHVGRTCAFTGTVTVFTRSGTVPLFTSSLFDGTLTRMSSTSVRLFARLVPNSANPSGGYVREAFTTNGASAMLSGSGIVTTPEPSALDGLLLGTGLLGLVEMARRKLQLGT